MRTVVRNHASVVGVTVAYALVLALIAWWPRHVDAGLGIVDWPVTRWLADLFGTDPRRINEVAQIAANVVLFVPLGALVARVLPDRGLVAAVIAGGLMSGLIEVVQSIALPDRTASWGDVAANTAGAVAGALVVAAVPRRPRARRVYLGLVGAVVLGVLGVLVWGLATPPTPRPASATPPVLPPTSAFAMTVTYVYDGDTVQATVDQANEIVTTTGPIRIRLIGVDAPEMTPEPQCGAEEATDWLRATLPVGATIQVAPDRDSWDDYGRRLFNVWTGDRFVNLDLVGEGQATTLRIWPNVGHAEVLSAAEQRAAAAERGLWSTCR